MFNKETEYALKSLVYIQSRNNENSRPGIAEISNETGAPQFFIGKILQRLVRQGFLESVKGKGGGFYFDGSKPEVRLLDLVRSIEGARTFEGCIFGLKQCNENNPCPLHNRFVEIRDGMLKLLREETIQSLALKLDNEKIHFNWLG
ncbi:MAG: Rrf2 family transcriptional regulator [Bacteroidales bacterium]